MVTQICECGIFVEGVNDEQLAQNIKAHKTSARHKKQMKLKKDEMDKGIRRRRYEDDGTKP